MQKVLQTNTMFSSHGQQGVNGSTPLRKAMTTTISGNANIQGQVMHNTKIVMSKESSCVKYSKTAIAKGNRKKKGKACFEVHECEFENRQ